MDYFYLVVVIQWSKQDLAWLIFAMIHEHSSDDGDFHIQLCDFYDILIFSNIKLFYRLQFPKWVI